MDALVAQIRSGEIVVDLGDLERLAVYASRTPESVPQGRRARTTSFRWPFAAQLPDRTPEALSQHFTTHLDKVYRPLIADVRAGRLAGDLQGVPPPAGSLLVAFSTAPNAEIVTTPGMPNDMLLAILLDIYPEAHAAGWSRHAQIKRPTERYPNVYDWRGWAMIRTQFENKRGRFLEFDYEVPADGPASDVCYSEDEMPRSAAWAVALPEELRINKRAWGSFAQRHPTHSAAAYVGELRSHPDRYDPLVARIRAARRAMAKHIVALDLGPDDSRSSFARWIDFGKQHSDHTVAAWIEHYRTHKGVIGPIVRELKNHKAKAAAASRSTSTSSTPAPSSALLLPPVDAHPATPSPLVVSGEEERDPAPMPVRHQRLSLSLGAVDDAGPPRGRASSDDVVLLKPSVCTAATATGSADALWELSDDDDD
ncbi:hypothetical protein Q5752_000853 [Cryptotrichosporon argae]